MVLKFYAIYLSIYAYDKQKCQQFSRLQVRQATRLDLDRLRQLSTITPDRSDAAKEGSIFAYAFYLDK